MGRSALFLAATTATLLSIAACVQIMRPPVEVDPLSRRVSFVDDVRPILDQRCVVCHSCYNAPCQLKLSSYEGLERGGSKVPVYDGTRLQAQDPTRLFFDAMTTEEWRSKGFSSVTESAAQAPFNDSILLQLLDAKRRNPAATGSYHSEADNLSCAADSRELSEFLDQHPHQGMPFGFPPLSSSEYAILATWLDQGATGPSAEEQKEMTTPSSAVAAKIEKWEAFLNQEDAKHRMTARYLYEHFFLAHLSFSDADPSQFYELVRSKTPSGQPIDVIATIRPYDSPDVDDFYYRFRRIHSTIVFKTHMVVEFSDETLARYQELFIDTPWLEPPYVVSLDDESGANPFLIYAQIPPQVRYEFLLDHSEYIIRTFIRGPVCKGQIALNVIHDQFWVFFTDPASDQIVLRPRFLIEQAQNLQLPTAEGSSATLLDAFTDDYRDRYERFYRAKTKLYETMTPEGLGTESIWRGRRPSDSPALTIYRHFDSASVRKGVLGDLPRTVWVIDYALLERIYYALVAGFDVFGNLTEQVNIRRYMDYLRIEGELNFLHYMPGDRRLPMLESWYIGDGAIEHTQHDEVVASGLGTKILYETDDPKREWVERVVNTHLLGGTGIAFDKINYHPDAVAPPMPKTFRTRDDVVNGFRSLTAPGTGFIRYYSEPGVNVIYLRIRGVGDEDRFVSIVINRWHDNVNSLFGEEKRLDPSKDTIDFLPGSIGSYPNLFFVVDREDLPAFFDVLENFDGTPEYLVKLRAFSVDRGDENFWQTYDWFQNRLDAQDPLRAGLYDLNRYYADADEKTE